MVASRPIAAMTTTRAGGLAYRLRWSTLCRLGAAHLHALLSTAFLTTKGLPGKRRGNERERRRQGVEFGDLGRSGTMHSSTLSCTNNLG